jgi:hypothetical protein
VVSVTAYGSRLFDQHAAMLAASNITPEHARERGYVSVDTKKRVADIGVTPYGRNIPGLLVPMRDNTAKFGVTNTGQTDRGSTATANPSNTKHQPDSATASMCRPASAPNSTTTQFPCG